MTGRASPGDDTRSAGLKVGFACAWDEPPAPTWSYTPWNLRGALRERTEVIDLGLRWAQPSRTVLKALGAYRHEGRWASAWKHHGVTQSLTGLRLRAAERKLRPDVVLQIGDLARLETPYFVYQDLSFDLLLDHFDDKTGVRHFPHLTASRIRRLIDRQHEIYAGAAGVLAMSGWLAEHLVRVTGLPEDRVHVVPPAANVLPAAEDRRPAVSAHRRKLLFVGKDFDTKAGPDVVTALGVLRRDVDPEIELTVVGPTTWPLPGQVPDGVRFLGRLPLAEVRRLYTEHDVFVMPSHFEGYGMALVEALAHGLPCVARDACAMPEIVRPGVNGALVKSDDAHELAGTIAAVLTDDGLAQRAIEQSDDVVARYSWDRVADDVLRIANGSR